jgi:hypothetical protein
MGHRVTSAGRHDEDHDQEEPDGSVHADLVLSNGRVKRRAQRVRLNPVLGNARAMPERMPMDENAADETTPCDDHEE